MGEMRCISLVWKLVRGYFFETIETMLKIVFMIKNIRSQNNYGGLKTDMQLQYRREWREWNEVNWKGIQKVHGLDFSHPGGYLGSLGQQLSGLPNPDRFLFTRQSRPLRACIKKNTATLFASKPLWSSILCKEKKRILKIKIRAMKKISGKKWRNYFSCN